MCSTLGDRIRAIREKSKLSMEDFGLSFDPKASKGVVSNWENNYNKPNKKRLDELARRAGKSTDELLYGNLKNYSYHVIIKDINSGGDFWEKFKLHYIRSDESKNNNFSPNEVSKDIAIKYVDNHFEQLYDIMLSGQKSMYANIRLNKPSEEIEVYKQRAEGKLMDYGREKEILMYAQYAIGQLLPFDTTYEESRELVVAKLKELPFFGTVYSYDELFERNIEQGMDETSAKIKAFNQFYKSELFGKVLDLERDIKKLDEEALIKKEELNLPNDK